MKKLLLIVLTIFLFLNSSNSYAYANLNKQENTIDNFKVKLESLDKYQLEFVDIRLKKLKSNYKNSANVLYVLNKLETLLNNEIINKGAVSYVNYDFVLDFSDYKNVLWFADNVFVWKVTKNIWTNNNWWDPETNFEVDVLYNIKWNLKWSISTVFEWGYENWILIIWEWTKLLEEWNTYLLVTMWDIHKISSHENWSYLINNEKNLKKDIKTIIKENKKIKDFREAYKNANNYSSKNKYLDLTDEQKKTFEDFDSWFVIN